MISDKVRRKIARDKKLTRWQRSLNRWGANIAFTTPKVLEGRFEMKINQTVNIVDNGDFSFTVFTEKYYAMQNEDKITDADMQAAKEQWEKANIPEYDPDTFGDVIDG